MVNARANGAVQLYFDLSGALQETFYDRLRFTPGTGVVRCADCHKIIRGLRYDDFRQGRIVSK